MTHVSNYFEVPMHQYSRIHITYKMAAVCPLQFFILFIVNSSFLLCSMVCANTTDTYYVELEPYEKFPMHIKENEEKEIMFYLRNKQGTAVKILTVIENPDLVEVEGNTSHTFKSETTSNFSTKIKGRVLGKTFLQFYMNTSADGEQDTQRLVVTNEQGVTDRYQLQDTYEITVSRVESALSDAFDIVVVILVCAANIGMGCMTELQVVKEVLRRPSGPLTGMFSQFILMPLIALAVIYIFSFDSANAIGFFAMACAPGGPVSNSFTYLLAGDVSLSVTMTLCSTILSVGMIPLWLFTVGTKVLYQTEVEIPYTNILISLAGLVVPVAIGMLIQWKKSNWAKYIVKGLKPLMIIFFIFVFTVGVYANLYIFTLMRNKPEILLAGALVPYIGFVFGGIMAFITRQSWKRIRTIAIETGIQNVLIAVVMLKVSLPPPDNDISIVAPLAVVIFAPVPVGIAVLGFEIYKRCNRKKAFSLNDHKQAPDGNGKEEIKNGGIFLVTGMWI